MADREREFTAQQAAEANAVLRTALGLPPQRFATEQFVGMISDEIEQLRAAGRSDEDISSLLSEKAGVDVAVDDLRRFYAAPAARRRSS